MMSAKFSDFLTPSPCLHLELISTIKFTQPPLLHPLFHDPPPPLMRISYLEAPSVIQGREKKEFRGYEPQPSALKECEDSTCGGSRQGPRSILLPCPENIYMSGPCWSADCRRASPMMIDSGAERDAEVCGPAA